MPILSPKSLERLDTCDTRLRRVIERAIKIVPEELDFTVLCGYRNEVDQERAFNTGVSRLKWPESRHNKQPAMAVDVVPFPIDWDDLNRLNRLASYIFRAAIIEKVDIEWGGHWPKFKDYPHWEIK